MHRIFLSLLFSFFLVFLFGQSYGLVAGSYLVQTKPETTQLELGHKTQNLHPFSIKKLGKDLPFWQIDFDTSLYKAIDILTFLESQESIILVQANHFVQHRDEQSALSYAGSPTMPPSFLPNDPDFPLQYALKNTGQTGGISGADLGMEAAWSQATGGKTVVQDDIVVCVIDHGVDASQFDLKENLWQNTLEIAQNGIDDDGNGYVDDKKGWNVFSKNDNIAGLNQAHGTAICGIIGAKGNNAMGIAGINWNVKIQMVVAGQSEGAILEAYAYAFQNRKLFNDTKGDKGTFVVATNASWGIDYGQASAAPIWCALYDSLGAVGILNCAAAPNLPIDVDLLGDLPCTCPSEYLCTVSSIDHKDALSLAASWGKESIDFVAYGEKIYTTKPSQVCGLVSGTSYAAPQLAAAIALLYSAPCSDLPALAYENPKAAALFVKNVLLDQAQNLPVLSNVLASGGKLHIGHTMAAYVASCSACAAPFGLYAQAEYEALNLSWTAAPTVTETDLRWRLANGGNWTNVQNITQPYTLIGLDTCTSIQVQLRGKCGGIWSDWSIETVLKTKGCCTVLSKVQLVSKTKENIRLNWSSDLASTGFELFIKNHTSQQTQHLLVYDTTLLIKDLQPCTSYEIKIRPLCLSADSSHFSPPLFVQTKGCGVCYDLPYCSSTANFAFNEYIEKVELNGHAYPVGAGAGYKHFDDYGTSPMPALFINEMNSIRLMPGFVSGQFKEYFRVFLDINHDGQFSDPEECLFDPGFACSCPVNGMLFPPIVAQEGITRMRILMRFEENIGTIPSPCGTFDYGQVADFCVALHHNVSPTEEMQNSIAFSLSPNPFSDKVTITFPQPSEGLLEVWNAQGQLVFSTKMFVKQSEILDFSGFDAGVYSLVWTSEDGVLVSKIVKI